MSSDLALLAAEASTCTACGLAETRTNVVFGAGAPDADLMFVGEAPGQQEDEQGLPFVGRSGQFLDQLLDEVGIERSRTYIANVVKCRPPGNRDPRPDEIEACKGYLRRQIELIQPTVVVTLGNFSTKLLLRTDTGITRLRGTPVAWWRGTTLLPTFHPAAALRGNASAAAAMREDFELMRRIIDERPGGGPKPEPDVVESAAPAGPAPEPSQLPLFDR